MALRHGMSGAYHPEFSRDVDLEHLVKVVGARLLHYKVTVCPFPHSIHKDYFAYFASHL